MALGFLHSRTSECLAMQGLFMDRVIGEVHLVATSLVVAAGESLVLAAWTSEISQSNICSETLHGKSISLDGDVVSRDLWYELVKL